METKQKISADILEAYGRPGKKELEEVDRLLQKEIGTSGRKIIVLDDDPTGVQTVHDISVYTDWDKGSVEKGFREPGSLFYILTNSRGFTAEQTTRVHDEIARVVEEVAEESGRPYILISRSDSTLRGHYPLETLRLKETIEEKGMVRFDGEILCPFFKEGGRYTLGNVHYVKYGDTLVPAAETEFARDKTFGYHSSDLREYVEEKTKGAFKAGDVTCISLESLRARDYDGIEAQLLRVEGFNKVVVNAVDYCDLKVFCTSLYRALKKGKNFLFRSGAALVKVIGGITDQPLLTREQMVTRHTDKGGIVVVGSHTAKTTEQLEALLTLEKVRAIEFNSDLVLEAEAFEEEIRRVVEECERVMDAGDTAVVYTRRKLLTLEHDTKEEALVRSVKISDAVQSLVARLAVTPSFVVAKGGITSSDIGTKALAVRRADVMGQIKPGIPVWRTGEESKFPATPYIIFPGNVGDATTLKEAVEVLLG
ncbi:four-carbon acid sugar kinase family protein [Anaerotalea alkaliphila]|uniref:Hydroxyacid dehydrogenase n=1 Tax=Anaerotalea alkaliphila TaxID=2662126 RepID=A0A7X5HV72_9FIRM|nr:four-carbon acid sugar kinase family protein [Anaerotalea alkaliphila]NDL67257.1 hydroxyacid dehydrogenase [Anaerotalea alkaliphila]